MTGKCWLIIGATFGALAVLLGAFGAHGLENLARQWPLEEAVRQKRLDNWEVAARYQMYHALALGLVGLLATRHAASVFRWSGVMLSAGVIVFSGCLYAYVLSGWSVLGMIVPIGGILLIGGWIALLLGVVRLKT